MTGQNKSESDSGRPDEQPEGPQAKGVQPIGQGSPPPPLPKKETERFRVVPGGDKAPAEAPEQPEDSGPVVVKMSGGVGPAASPIAPPQGAQQARPQQQQAQPPQQQAKPQQQQAQPPQQQAKPQQQQAQPPQQQQAKPQQRQAQPPQQQAKPQQQQAQPQRQQAKPQQQQAQPQQEKPGQPGQATPPAHARRHSDRPIADNAGPTPGPGSVQKKKAFAIPDEVGRVLTSTTSSPRHKIEAWLAVMCKEGASDLILRASGRPSIRVNGRIDFLPGRVPGPGALLEVLEGVMGERRMETWRETGSSDAGLHLDGLGRFRLNAYKQIGEPAVVIRRISEDAPSINGLNLPAEELKRLAMKKRGLVLVTGVAGSGKSTTLGGMIEHMNQTVNRHVVTLEDPVELLFKENRCVISQREVGTDCTTFQDGLRHALRQSPDVILIGEMRDAETVMAALDASETGHLVLSTLHTVNAPQTMERILSFFPAEQHKQVRGRLSDNIAGVMSQRLVVTSDDSGLVPAYELMVSTPHVRELLAVGDTAELARVIDGGTEKGLVSFNQCLRQLVLKQKIHLEEAMQASDRPEELVLALRGITGSNAKVDTSSRTRQQPEGGNDGLRMASSGE